MSSVTSFLKLSPRETLLDEWEVLDDAGFPDVGDYLSILLGFFFCGLPGLMGIWFAISRPRRVGYLCLTNLRCLYVERGEGMLKSSLRIAATNLNDVVAVHSAYEETVMGTQSLTLVIYTKFEDTIGIRMGEAGHWYAKLPVLGALFHRHSLGRDALKVSPLLFDRIVQRRATAAGSGAAY